MNKPNIYHSFQELQQNFNPAESNTRKPTQRETVEEHVNTARELNQERLQLTSRYFLQYYGRGEADGLEML